MDKVKLEEENEFLESIKKGRVKEWRFKNLKHSQTAKEQLRQSLMSSEDTITIEEARERLSKK